jgi:hypothetical protein
MARSAVGGGFEMMVAEAAIAAAGNAYAIAQFGQVGDQGFIVGFVNFRAGWNLEHDVIRIGSGAQTSHAMACGSDLEMLLVAVVDEGVKAVHGFNPHIAALAAVTTIGTAHFDEFLAPKRYGTGPAITGAHIDFCFVKKFHGALYPFVSTNPRAYRNAAIFVQSHIKVTFTQFIATLPTY